MKSKFNDGSYTDKRISAWRVLILQRYNLILVFIYAYFTSIWTNPQCIFMKRNRCWPIHIIREGLYIWPSKVETFWPHRYARYLDDIFTIDNPEFEKHISDIYPAELQLNKANTSDKEIQLLFLDLNIKVIGSDIHTRVYDKRDEFGFPIVNFPWLSGDVPRLPSYGIYISQLVRFARCCTSVLDFHLKNSKLLQNCWHRCYRYHKLRKTFGKFFSSYSELLLKIWWYFVPRIFV